MLAWHEFVRDKTKKRDVQAFSLRLMDNILALHDDLVNLRYTHGGYHAFRISDPKPRDIHKASVRDRLVHHAIYRILYPFFDRTFIADSYSCRIDKGTHRAMNRFRAFAYEVSKNHTRTVWVLKCDIKKFFASIDHTVLIKILERSIPDARSMALLRNIVGSFSTRSRIPSLARLAFGGKSGMTGRESFEIGLPLGNLTSQLFCNIYMNESDQFVKHTLHARYYIRYADDFVILSHDKQWLEELLPQIAEFLEKRLYLTLHPHKVSIETVASGVDFLGWVHFPDHRVLRTATKKRMMRRIEEHPTKGTMRSYRGLLSHGNAKKLRRWITCSSSACRQAGTSRTAFAA